MKKLSTFLLVTVLTFSVGCAKKNISTEASLSESPTENVELIVSAAASLTDVTKEIADKYKEINPNIKLTFTYGASGALQTQIEEGAPSDVFISAGLKQMNALDEKGLIVGDTNKELLINTIVLIIPEDSQADIKNFEDCATDKVKSIALGDPKTTPAGQYGNEVFTNLNVLEEVTPKVNLASDVRQVLTWVEMGEVDCGVVFMTDALSSDKVKVAASAPEGSHNPAIYPVGIIKASTNQEEAQKFVDFLYTDDARMLFEKSGFSMAN